ncbi:uncharacterized protein MAM_01241 [Metarhizium album ARSEF 1941]|uniref:DUF3328 domain protein n=1 Tax=Metarhizium album (strain ARSEF 1941) TaxID=1081103 RepID=A0A0B2X3Y1_METAS|nr:uncharacterized protein MAM_01241 [Metarhizium album ARSEF 1941]KHO00463.1 hypothetical protein MAM_01241 [Metarhizium album ARSEF 1941]
MLWRQRYKPLRQGGRHASHGDAQLDHDDARPAEDAALARARRTIYVLVSVLALTTVLLAVLLVARRGQPCSPDPSSFFDLRADVPVAIAHDGRAIDDAMWDSPEYDWYLGWVALQNDEAESKGLPTAMRWPWDSSRSIYILHGFHSLHCVFVLRDAIMQYHGRRPQAWPYGHVTHCLHVLREDVVCAADDTPRYTGRLHAQENETVVESGIGQLRMCRDWNELRRHAMDNSACYYRPPDHYVPLLDRYKRCPDGSTPWEKGRGDKERQERTRSKGGDVSV